MKLKLNWIIILALLSLSLIQTTGIIGQSKIYQNQQDQAGLNDVYSSTDSEILPIDENSLIKESTEYHLGPIVENNYTSNFLPTTKVNDENDQLIVNIDLEKSVVAPNDPVNYLLQTTQGITPVSVNLIVEIIQGEYWDWYYSYYYDYDDYSSRIIETHYITTNLQGIWSSTFITSQTGRFTIVVRTQSNSFLTSRAFSVSSIGIFWRSPYQFVEGEMYYSVAYILNIADFSPLPGVEVELTGNRYFYNPNTSKYEYVVEKVFSGITDDRGIIEPRFIPSSFLSQNYWMMLNFSARYQGETTFISRDIYRGGYMWTWDGYWEYQPYEFVITTDKPIYFPGESIKARFLIWKNDFYKVTKDPLETEFEIEIASPSQHILLHKKVSSNKYGITTLSFTLDVESELGQYTLIAKKDKSVGSLQIRVDKYEKPSFRVSIGLDKEYIVPGQTITGNISAQYYFGRPVSGGVISLAIGNLVVLQGTTNSEGYWKFKYTISKSIDPELKSIPINVTVTDTVGRKVLGTAAIIVTNQVYTWAYVNPWFPRINENISVYLGAYQYTSYDYYWASWTPLADASIKMILFGILSDDQNVSVMTLTGRTDSSGQGKIIFQIPQSIAQVFTRYAGLIEVDAGDGRKGTTTIYFTLDRNIVVTSLNSNNFDPGEIVELSLKVINGVDQGAISGNVKIRIYDADYELIGMTTRSISKSGEIINIKLSSYAPSGKYNIRIYLETKFDSYRGFWQYHRYVKTVDFTVGPIYSLSLTTDKSNYSLGDKMTLTGELSQTLSTPLMIQFVKRGIVNTYFISLDGVLTFNVYISDLGPLAPKFWVDAFGISTNGLLITSNLEVKVDSNLIINIKSSKQIYEPGDSAQISISVKDSVGNPIASILAVSFVDSSVYGVEADPESELTHFEDEEYWPAVWTVVSWKNLQQNWWFWWYEDYNNILGIRGGYWYGGVETGNIDYMMPPTSPDEKTQDQGTPKTRKEIRDNLPENAYWKPQIVLISGQWSETIFLPDNIGEWTVRVVATTQSGNGQLEKYTFNTFLPFFVEIDKDPYVLQDEIFVIRGIVYNYLDQLLDINLQIEVGEGIIILSKDRQLIRLPGGFLGSIGWACLANKPGYHNVTISAETTTLDGTAHFDAIRKSHEVTPNGVEEIVQLSGFISSSPVFSYSKFEEAISSNEFLQLDLGLGSIALSSWERLIGYPYGCTEQTISRLIPNALILQYLRETGILTNDTEELISDMILSGISRLYSQQHFDGGWGWWHDDTSRVYMTSIVLYGLGVVNNSEFHLDLTVIKAALEFLKIQQNFDGSWTVDSWRNIDKASYTAFVLRAFTYWKAVADYSTIIENGVGFIQNTWNQGQMQSNYLAGLYLTNIASKGYSTVGFDTQLITYLTNHVKISNEGYYWTYATEENYWWKALGGDVEVTSLALEALVKLDPSASVSIIRGALGWILQRQNWYGWGNTADTSAAISCILSIASSGISSNEDATVTLVINGDEIQNIDLSIGNQPNYYLRLDDLFQNGNNTIQLIKSGMGNVTYYFQGVQILRKLPIITVLEKITAQSGQNVALPISLTPRSEKIFCVDLKVVPVVGDIVPVPNLPQTISFLAHPTIIYFNYIVPTFPGLYSIPGFDVSYRLSNQDQEIFSPAIISRRYGPVLLEVKEFTEGVLSSNKVSTPKDFPQALLSSKTVDDTNGLSVKRDYSQISSYHKGNMVLVTITIENTLDVQNYLMLEDFLPSGFQVEPTTVQSSHGIFKQTSLGVVFFFPELNKGKTLVQYGIAAYNVRQSLVRPARLSSMYDSWEVLSTPTILGDSRLQLDPSTGDIQKDLQNPTLGDVTISEELKENIPVLSISIEAFDNWGISSARIFIKQDKWTVSECNFQNTKWEAIIYSLNEGESEIYIELIDNSGNVFVSDEITRYLELKDLYIPTLSILILLAVSAIIAVSVSLIIQKNKKY